jgi:AraC family transcriptional regulator
MTIGERREKSMSTSTISRDRKIDPIRPAEIPVLEKGHMFIAKNFRRGGGFVEAAKAAGLSPFHFHYRYTKHFGETPKATAVRLQIEMAKVLILTTPLADVADACGFSNQSHFSCRFKQLTGVRPLQWRRKNAT